MAFTFALAPGAWGDKSIWTPTAAYLEAEGHRVITADFRFNDLGANFEDDARVLQAAIEGYDKVFAASYSRGVEGLWRALASDKKEQFIGALMINTGLPHQLSVPDESQAKLSRYTPGYENGLVYLPDGSIECSPQHRLDYIYRFVRDRKLAEKMAAAGHSRQRGPDDSPLPPLPPRIAVGILQGAQDPVLNLERVYSLSDELSGVTAEDAVEWAGHCLPLEAPQFVARRLVKYALQVTHALV